MIPRRIIRVWIGDLSEIPFQGWWEGMQDLHPDYQFLTITDFSMTGIPRVWRPCMHMLRSKAAVSDLIRILALHKFGGIYVDTDVTRPAAS